MRRGAVAATAKSVTIVAATSCAFSEASTVTMAAVDAEVTMALGTTEVVLIISAVDQPLGCYVVTANPGQTQGSQHPDVTALWRRWTRRHNSARIWRVRHPLWREAGWIK